MDVPIFICVYVLYAEEDQYRPLHPIAMLDVAKRRQAERRENLFTDFGPHSRALTEKADLEIRSVKKTSTSIINSEWTKRCPLFRLSDLFLMKKMVGFFLAQEDTEQGLL